MKSTVDLAVRHRKAARWLHPSKKDSLTDYQVARQHTPNHVPDRWDVHCNEIKPNPKACSIRVPDIRVDDYIVDANIGRIGADHRQ